MYLPPPHPIGDFRICVIGDVQIHANAVIAPGVLLCADSDAQILIGAGVCVGLGTVLHACQGTLEVGEGANLGTGVLFVGKGKIGNHACIGSSTTLLNVDIAAGAVISPGSLIGDHSRQASDLKTEPAAPDQENLPPTASPEALPIEAHPVPTPPDSSPAPKPSSQVYGKGYLNQMMGKIFPKNEISAPIEDPWKT
jgi:carbon dioxide concentrating mechanism protein CcmN